ncbi:flagellar basal body-associated FliL family protein [Isoptericola sp. b490]|uniref:flagellar basal body-associated FliL family protein n=1 Tax=Actinotalea lenta TaxID=3064654 RepID=UPI00271354E8|nr:flagellar basal body-associated FliL family protein [Isoptericola sp. b490]MDO8122170.1 flagellar basal body-associated FliL family protein [Isoptericola sp. b490]
MATETRVVADKKKIGAKGGSGAVAGGVDEVPAKKGKKALIAIILVVVLLAAGAGYWFVLKPKSAGASAHGTPAASAASTYKPGKVLVIDSVSINLAGGHYLRLGIALQLTDSVHQDPETAKALDLAIALFSQKPLDEVNDVAKRAALKAELRAELEHAYEGEVMDVYFTDFVTQ